MRYTIISSKFVYYTNVIMTFGVVIAFGIGLNIIALSKNPWLIFLILCMAIVAGYVFYICTVKFIFASIDLKHKTLVFGNILFSQEVDWKQIEIAKASRILRKTSKIVIDGKFNYVLTPRQSFKEYLDSARSS